MLSCGKSHSTLYIPAVDELFTPANRVSTGNIEVGTDSSKEGQR